MSKYEIIVVEDDKMVANLMTTTLEMSGFSYIQAATGEEAIEKTKKGGPDIMLLDLGLPDMNGVDVIEAIRPWCDMPIIVVSARTDTMDKVDALDAGADDYLTKPFSVDELLARIRVALRRVEANKGGGKASEGVYINGDLRIDYGAGCAYIEGDEIHLTPMEYKLLCLLAKNTGKVISYNYILKEIWGGVNESDMASLRVFMTVLRRVLHRSGDKYIQTHVGVGYRMLSHE